MEDGAPYRTERKKDGSFFLRKKEYWYQALDPEEKRVLLAKRKASRQYKIATIGHRLVKQMGRAATARYRSKLEAKIGHRRMKQMERAANARGNATAKATGRRKLYDARRRAKVKARRKDANDEGAAATKALATTLALPRKRRRKDAPTRVEEYIEPANLCDRYVHWIMKRAAFSQC